MLREAFKFIQARLAILAVEFYSSTNRRELIA